MAMRAFLPELLQHELVGVVNLLDVYVRPKSDSAITERGTETIRSMVHVEVVSEVNEFLTKTDLDKNSVTLDDVSRICHMYKERILLKYLPSLRRRHWEFHEHERRIDDVGIIRISFVICEPGMYTGA